MLAAADIRLALPNQAQTIAELSRDSIEYGLPWTWTCTRILQAIRDLATNVAVVQRQDRFQGFGIMHYGDESAHLALLAVQPAMRHQGLGMGLVHWLEASARTAGIGRVRLEARADNHNAIAFYRQLGYSPTGTVAAYYQGRIDAIRMERRLDR